eukprot:scaffold18316_cov119-Isochrysis_galbana.AAC.4
MSLHISLDVEQHCPAQLGLCSSCIGGAAAWKRVADVDETASLDNISALQTVVRTQPFQPYFR